MNTWYSAKSNKLGTQPLVYRIIKGKDGIMWLGKHHVQRLSNFKVFLIMLFYQIFHIHKT